MERTLKRMKVPGLIRDRVKEAAAVIESTEGTIRLISHDDGDGIISAGIMSLALRRAGKRFHATMGKVLDGEGLERFSADYDLLMVMDMGSSIAEEISEKTMDDGIRSVILDHHKVDRDSPYTISDGRGVMEVNPRFHGINGTTGCCASTLSFLVSLAMDKENMDLSVFSLAGAIADRQHVPEFSDLNKGIRDIAVEEGLLGTGKGLPLSGRNIEEALVMSNDPFIPGISGQSSRVASLLDMMDIEPGTKIEALPEDRLKMLNSYVYTLLLDQGVDPEAVNGLLREQLVSNRLGNIESLAYDIDSCGRNGEMGVGLGVVWGNQQSIKRAREHRFRYRKKIQEQLLRMSQGGINEMENIEWMKVEDDALSGNIASLALTYIRKGKKPILSIFEGEGGRIKISARGNHRMVNGGLDLGKMLDRACREYGGSGGGHDVAAGGNIDAESLVGFLAMADRIVGRQFSGVSEDES